MKRTLRNWGFVTALALTGSAAGATTQVITTANFSFMPSSFTINLGDTVVWQWSNGSHNTQALSVPTGAFMWLASSAPLNSSTTTFTYIPAAVGTYTYNCGIHPTTMNGTFTVNCGSGPTKPVIISSTGSATTCAGTTYMLSIPTQGGASYQWSNGSGAISGATAASFTPTTSGTYIVKVSRCSVDSVSAPFTVTINPNPVPAFTQTHTGLAYTFTNTTSPVTGNNYLWTLSDGSPTQATTNATRTFTAPGTYTVTLKATNSTTSCATTSSPLTVNAQSSNGVGSIGKSAYSITPNPARSQLSIAIAEEASAQLTDLTGRIIVQSPASKTHQLEVSTIPAGIYLLQLQTRAGTASERISVVH